MKIKDGMDVLPTVSGLICSILLSTMIIIYTVQKGDVLFNKKGDQVFSTVQTSVISDNFEQNSETGLKIAVAFAEFSNNREPKLKKELGRIVLMRYAWGQYANGTTYSTVVEVESHFCSQEELGLTKSDNEETEKNAFFPIAERFERDFRNQQNKFVCFEEEDMRLNGDFNSVTSSGI